MAGSVTREVIIGIQIRMGKFTPPPVEGMERAWSESGKKAGDTWQRNFRGSIAEALNEAKRASSTPLVAPSTNAIFNPQQMQSAAEGLRRAGEGAFALGRGLAFLSAQSEDELQVVIRRIAAAQGLFDIYRGSVDVVGGLTQSIRGLAAARAVETAAAAGSTAATVASTGALATAKAAGGSLAAILTGPVGIGIAATSLAVGAGYLLWRDYNRELMQAAQNSMRLVNADDILYHSQQRLVGITQVRNRLASDAATRSALSSVMLDSRNASGAERIMQLDRDAEAARAKSLLSIYRIGDTARIRTGLDDASNFGLPDLKSQKAIAKDPQKYFAQILKSLGGMEGTKPLSVGDISQFRAFDGAPGSPNRLKQIAEVQKLGASYTASLNEEIQKTNSLKANAEAQNSALRERLSLLGQERSALTANLQIERDKLRAISDAQIADRQARMSVAERLGRLNPGEQQQVAEAGRIVEQSGFGGLRQDQRDLLDRLGLADSASQRFYLDKGNQFLGKDQKLFQQLGTFGLTPQEALKGGTEGEDRANLLAFQKQFSNARSNSLGDALSALSKSIAQTEKDLSKGIEATATIEEKIGELGASLQRASKVFERVVANQGSQQTQLEILAREALESNISGRG